MTTEDTLARVCEERDVALARAEAAEKNLKACQDSAADRLRAEVGRERAAKGIALHEHRLALGHERKQLATANALLDRIEEFTGKHPFVTRDWFVSLFAERRRLTAQPATERKEGDNG